MDQPIVSVSNVKYRGSKDKSPEGFEYYAFKGIPYAEPPIGELRFKDPVPLKKTFHPVVKDALKYASPGPQFDMLTQKLVGSEDCLYLNIFSKTLDSSKLSPVMVYIHGGGFFFGSGDDAFYGPEYLLKKDIVLVTINYRLGILGFLNLEHKCAPGNQGLKDQVMALEWVQNNIKNFGGDPNNVTIFGQSAGGASVHLLCLSPMANGLFHKAISQSGVATCSWASVYGDPKPAAYKMCERLGKKITNPQEIVEFLRTVDALKLIELQTEIATPGVQADLSALFAPGVDDQSERPFMPIPIDDAAQQGVHVPYIMGQTDRESGFLVTTFESATDPQVMNDHFKKSLHPRTLEVLKNNKLFPEDLKRLYFKDGKITKDNMEASTDLLGDMFFNYAIQNVLKAQIKRNSAPTYFYEFAYDQGCSVMKLLHSLKTKGAYHMDELIYLFNMKYLDQFKVNPVKESNNHKVMEQMVELWTNFAKTGNPTYTKSENVPVRWLPVTDGTTIRYLHVGEDVRMSTMLNIEERLSYKKDQ